jgi:diacylglycerol kinase (ATP)
VQVSSLFRLGGHRPLRAKLIFNANSGRPGESPQQLATILSEMQYQNILPEVFMVRPDNHIEEAVRGALKAGIQLIVVAGGDGTIDSVAGPMVGTSATLGIIPTGTRNNVALNLGIPNGIAEAVALLRKGHRRKVDVGHIRRGRLKRWFLEAATVGLLSDIYPVADNIQHGNLAQIGDLLSTFFAAAPSKLKVVLDGREHIETVAHMMLIANMSFIGPHFQISPRVSFKDNRLDVFIFSGMSKLNLISYVMQALAGPVERDDIKHYRVRQVKISASPKMPVLADGVLLGQGATTILVRPRALNIMAGTTYAGQPLAALPINGGVAVNG